MVRSEVGYMDLPDITSSMIKDHQQGKNNELQILQECWKSAESCSGKVTIDGNVIFHVESEDKLQYRAYHENVGMVYTLQPGNIFL